MDFVAGAAETLGQERVSALAEIAERTGQLREPTQDVTTIDSTASSDGRGGRSTVANASHSERAMGVCVCVESDDGTSMLVVDEASMAGIRDPLGAVVYPELHMRLVTWWLVHAWRGIDLLDDAVLDLQQWRIFPVRSSQQQ